MNPNLNDKRLEYLFFHLDHNHFEMTPDIKKRLRYASKIDIKKSGLIFFLADNATKKNIIWHQDIPVLFGSSQNDRYYKIDANGNLVFYYDLLKSAFYFLSGVQELNSMETDDKGRFPYEKSLQYILKITTKPVVNEYFKIITDAIEEFCRYHKLNFKKRNLWNNDEYGFLLTHDVDRVDKWTFREFVNQSKLLVKSGFLNNYSNTLSAFIKLFSQENPYWVFDWMTDIENKYGHKAIWFFLPKGDRNIDAYYSFNEERIRRLASEFEKKGDMLGLHGTYFSRLNENVMPLNLKQLYKLTSNPVYFVRQHWLSFKYPETLRIQETLGFQFDSSWGFAAHHGWRNSYCLPFRPYDIEQERIMKIWELPLNAMEVTFNQYLTLDLDNTYTALETMKSVCRKYGGLFVLLWHNNHLDESKTPGIKEFYQKVIAGMKIKSNPDQLLKTFSLN